MRMTDIIEKKKRDGVLTAKEISFAVSGYVAGKIPDYQMAALLMAICFTGMDDGELVALTTCMEHSGQTVDLSGISGIKVDKHSTGGVGDKTTLVVAPVVAACGGKVAKMAGRGLGFTGGTIDKLESIPGFQTQLSRERFIQIVEDVGVAVMGQSADIAPADKKIYALRDVTGTVDSIPLIAASIMSKKLASGSDKIVLDVTVGSGAFMKTKKEAELLAQKMVAIGEGAGRETVAVLTDMDEPLGQAVGNICEVKEAVALLNGKGPEDLRRVCEELAVQMLLLSGIGSRETCLARVRRAMTDGSASDKLAQMVRAQGGDDSFIANPEKFPTAPFVRELKATNSGFVTHMDTERCGKAAGLLGAGRQTKDSTLDMTAGITFVQKTGAKVQQGQTLALLYAQDETKVEEAAAVLEGVYTIGKESADADSNKNPILGFFSQTSANAGS